MNTYEDSMKLRMTAPHWAFVSLLAGAFLGVGIYHWNVERDLDGAFEAGREQGRLECASPSRLERAVEWVSQPPRGGGR